MKEKKKAKAHTPAPAYQTIVFFFYMYRHTPPYGEALFFYGASATWKIYTMFFRYFLG